MSKHHLLALFWLSFSFASSVQSQNAVPPTIADPEFQPTVQAPLYKTGEGPLVVVDQGHQNFHTIAGRYGPFAQVLEKDGFRVEPIESKFDAEALAAVDVLVIASAAGDLNPNVPEKWQLPVPSAFTESEIHAVQAWVKEGGALLLIVDYMPLAATAATLAERFGIEIGAGYAYDSTGENKLQYTRSNNTLLEHPITRGRDATERVDVIHTFAGTALNATSPAQPLLGFGAGAYLVQPNKLLMPDTPPADDAPRMGIEGWSQATVTTHGKGRVAVFGEAAVFTAQRYPDGAVMGMNHPDASDNQQLLLNTFHWLVKQL